jgi:hypothetical protein
MLVLLVVTALSVYKPWGLTGYGQRKQLERQYDLLGSRATVGIKAMSGSNKKSFGGSFSRGLRISLAAGVGAFVVLVHVSMFLTGHSFHHGH